MPVTFTDDRILSMAKNMEEDHDFDLNSPIQELRDKLAKLAEERKDFIEAHEIRTGRPWNKWTNDDLDLLVDLHPFETALGRNPAFLNLIFAKAEGKLPLDRS